MIKLIVALGPNNLIGSDDKMPWHSSTEFAHFKATTMGKWLLMGQTTYKSLPTKLKGRKIAMLGPSKSDADKLLKNTKETIEFLNEFKGSKDIYISGGKSIYENFYHLADELTISEMTINNLKGNVYLDWDLSNFEKKLIKEEKEFNVYKYTRRKNGN